MDEDLPPGTVRIRYKSLANLFFDPLQSLPLPVICSHAILVGENSIQTLS